MACSTGEGEFSRAWDRSPKGRDTFGKILWDPMQSGPERGLSEAVAALVQED